MNRKIEAMHNTFGKLEGHICKECDHLIQYYWRSKRYYKCEVYGESHSEATDWRLKYGACGLFNKETPERNLYKVIKPMRVQAVLDGQMKIDL